jgi:histidinol dehydrogenase
LEFEFKFTNMNKIYNPTPESWSAILERPTKTIDDIETVKEIFKEVQKKGDEAILHRYLMV